VISYKIFEEIHPKSKMLKWVVFAKPQEFRKRVVVRMEKYI
jgi:hypothetical protein